MNGGDDTVADSTEARDAEAGIDENTDVHVSDVNAVNEHKHVDVHQVEAHEVDEQVEPEQVDEQVDSTEGDRLDSLDDGGSAVGRSDSISGALPFVVSAREEFAALNDLPVTGDARVDAATARLDEVAELPTADHVTVYDDVHRRLQDALSDADVR